MPLGSPTLISSWTFDTSVRDEVMAVIVPLMRSVLPGQPGFVSSRLYESSDRGSVLIAVQMESVRDRQRAMEVPQVRTALRHLRRIADSHADLYELVESIDAGA